jgi:hypothetical protein
MLQFNEDEILTRTKEIIQVRETSWESVLPRVVEFIHTLNIPAELNPTYSAFIKQFFDLGYHHGYRDMGLTLAKDMNATEVIDSYKLYMNDLTQRKDLN